MKINKYICLALLSVGLVSTSCVDDAKFGDPFLEKAPGVDMSIDEVFSRAEYARSFLWENYRRMYYGLPTAWDMVDGKMNQGMFESLSDCWHSHLDWDGPNRTYYSGIYNADMENWDDHLRFSFTKENCWEAVRASWIFIENVERVPDMPSDEKERLKAEAKVIIASRYFDLFRHYGGLPIVEGSIPLSSDIESYKRPRKTVEETLDFMIKLLDEASAVLPWALPETEIANWDGRFTKAGSMGLKCKVLLFAASPLFNDNVAYTNEEPQEAVTNHHVWIGAYKPELWVSCLTACEDFFKELQVQGRYGLVQASGTSVNDYRSAFRKAYFTRGSGGANPEILISTRVKYSYGGGWDYNFVDACSWGAYTPTQEFVEMFPMSDGTPFNWSDANHVKDMFTNRDPRLFETILVNGADYQGRQVELWVGGRESQKQMTTESGEFATGYANYKYVLDYNTSRGQATQWPYLRMAEIHLIYAEALMKANRIASAIEQVDIVRKRVGLRGLTASNPGKNMNDGKVLLEEILRERACELGLEDVRLFDMIRHKREQDFKKVLHRLVIKRTDGKEESWSDKPEASRGPRPTDFTYEVKEIANIRRSWWTSFSPKWYLAAFPTNEVNKGYGLTQNPGW